jgi:hypothetical protein
MKAILKFNLDDPEDKQAHLRAIKSLDLVLALLSIKERFRSINKYNEGTFNQKEFFEVLESYGIQLDELVS